MKHPEELRRLQELLQEASGLVRVVRLHVDEGSLPDNLSEDVNTVQRYLSDALDGVENLNGYFEEEEPDDD